MVKLDMLVNSEPVDAFSLIVHQDKAEQRGEALAEKQDIDPSATIQSSHTGCYRESRRSFHSKCATERRDSKCYGGDIAKTEAFGKAEEGKKRMKSIGSVNIPQSAFIEVLKA